MTLRQNQNAVSQRANTSPIRSQAPYKTQSATANPTTTAHRLSNAPMLSASSSSNHSLFAFNRNGESGHSSQSGSYDFLPSVSFDDLHASIESASSDFKLTQFPSPNGDGSILDSQSSSARKGPEKPPAIRNSAIPPATNRNGRSGSIVRRSSTSSRQPSTSSIGSSWSGSVDAPTAASSNASRPRRQSHYPPVSNSNTTTTTTTTKAPRKSIGPGVLPDAEAASRTNQRRRPSVIGTDSARTSIDGSDSTRRFSGNARAAKTKSIQPSPRPSQTNLTPNVGAADTNRLSMAARSPRIGTRGTTPSSGGSKRASMMPGSHGLGARTISPTDTRRMKRMSMMPSSQPQAFDQSMVVPPAPISMETHSDSRSPSLPYRKASATPSSARGTPDQTRRSSVPGTAAGPTPVSSVSSTQRMPQVPPTARLPPQKHHNTQSSSTPNDESQDVPPVPAIPKAYESPKEAPAEAYFTEKKKSVIGSSADTPSHQTDSTGSITMPTNPEPTKVRRRPSARKSTFVPGTKANETTSSMQSKKALAPLTLPPLNLGPINFPAPAKGTRSKDAREHGGTVSPPRQPPKTPTTPMTASKSTFFSKSRYHDALEELPAMRSSSSIHQTHRTDSNSDASSSSSSMAQDASKKPSMSPFLSSSLPKSGGFEHNPLTRSKTGGDCTISTDTDTTEALGIRKPSGPRLPQSSKHSNLSPPPIPATEKPATPSSMSSLRRKLSISWKRGNSKGSASGSVDSGDKIEKASSQQAQPQSQQQQSNAKKQEMMPPPRIPVSASYNLTSSKPRSPVSSNLPTSNFARRRKSSASSLNHTAFSANFGDSWGAKKDTNESLTMPVTRLSTSTATTKSIKPKTSNTGLRQATSFSTELDKDDMAANEEMRKMGSRRKETDVAARTLDALKKRATPKERVGPQEAIRIAMLNIYERGEIIDYNDVYFCGTQSARKVVGNVQSDAPNFGYDDERGDYTIVPGDHLSFRYEIVDVLGKGSFGQVVRCIDHKHGTLVAVKIIRNKKRFHQQALVEVNILQKLREWDPQDKHSMVNFTQSFYFRGHLCISTELLDMNLYEFIKAHSFRGFSLRIVRRFTKQILSSLILLKKRKVIHCDLKPENILLRHPLNSELKVIDFGSSCFEHEKVYTYIQSRFYRSPEVILGMTYGLPIDMWSVGCILAELFTGVPIFPGENEQEQLACIMEVFGPPEKHLIEKSTRRKLFFDSMGKPRLTVSSKGRRRRPSSKTLQQVLKCDDEAFIDFLARCLRWDPERRLKPEDAVRHEFITGHKMPSAARIPTRDPSPVKRSSTLAMPRPLPDPPGGKPKVPGSIRTGSSPQKHLSLAVASSRRASVATSATAASLNRRTSAGPGITASTSGLPRIATRSASGKQDLAAAGATAAMRRN